MTPSRNLLRCTAALAVLGLAPAEESLVIRSTRIPVRLSVTDPSTVAKASFWVTSDGGKTWTQPVEVARGADGAVPVYTFLAPADGTYGFHTAATFTDGRSEPGPVAGAAVPAGSCLTVDTTSPSILRFEVSPESLAGANRLVKVAWTCEDLHLERAPVRLQTSVDAKIWKDFASGLPASGSGTFHLDREARLRLVAIDRAGNTATSTVWSPEAAATVTPDVKPTAATGLVEKPDPVEDKALAALKRMKEAEAKLAETKKKEAEEPPARIWTVPPGHQDVTVPAGKAGPSTPPGNGVTAPTTPVATDPSLIPVGRDISPSGLPADIDRVYERALAGEARPGSPYAKDEPAQTKDADILRELPAGSTPLMGETAQKVLNTARRAMAQGDHDRALTAYARLRDGSQASTALAEESSLRHRLGQRREALALIAKAPPEAIDDRVRCVQARILLDERKPAEAEAVLRRISTTSDRTREARFLTASALRAMKRGKEADAVLDDLARGDDAWGRAARELRK